MKSGSNTAAVLQRLLPHLKEISYLNYGIQGHDYNSGNTVYLCSPMKWDFGSRVVTVCYANSSPSRRAQGLFDMACAVRGLQYFYFPQTERFCMHCNFNYVFVNVRTNAFCLARTQKAFFCVIVRAIKLLIIRSPASFDVIIGNYNRVYGSRHAFRYSIPNVPALLVLSRQTPTSYCSNCFCFHAAKQHKKVPASNIQILWALCRWALKQVNGCRLPMR